MHRLARTGASRVCGCRGVATCLARYAPIASPEREPNERTNERTDRRTSKQASERTNERPTLSKDKGGNSPRQIIEWPDSASLSLSFCSYPQLHLTGFFILARRASTTNSDLPRFSHTLGKRGNTSAFGEQGRVSDDIAGEILIYLRCSERSR